MRLAGSVRVGSWGRGEDERSSGHMEDGVPARAVEGGLQRGLGQEAASPLVRMIR